MTSANDYSPQIGTALSKHVPALRVAFGFLAGATDAATILLLSVGTGVLYHRLAYGHYIAITDFVQVGLLTAWLYLLPNAYLSTYAVTNYLEFKRHPELIARFWSLTFVCLITLGFLTKTSDNYSRVWLVMFYASGLPVIVLLHALLVRALTVGNQASWFATRRVFLVGYELKIVDFMRRVRSLGLGLEIVGTAPLSPPPVDDFGSAHAQRFTETLNAAVGRVRALDLDSVFVLVPWSDQEAVDLCIEAFMTVPVSVHLGPERILSRFDNITIEKIGPIASLHLLRPPLSIVSVVVKRLFDFAVATVALVGLSPLLIVVAILIKLDSPGPIFFLQRRFGFNQKPFRIVKFRTMTTLEDGTVIRQTVRNDRRLTRLGSFLRHWNIDELPQLFNVLIGQMSLVGPRPHALAHDRAWGLKVALYARRHNVKPGITGWAQVNGFRGNIDSDDQLRERVAFDLYYIDNWSIWLDIKILFATVFFSKTYQNAY